MSSTTSICAEGGLALHVFLDPQFIFLFLLCSPHHSVSPLWFRHSSQEIPLPISYLPLFSYCLLPVSPLLLVVAAVRHFPMLCPEKQGFMQDKFFAFFGRHVHVNSHTFEPVEICQ